MSIWRIDYSNLYFWRRINGQWGKILCSSNLGKMFISVWTILLWVRMFSNETLPSGFPIRVGPKTTARLCSAIRFLELSAATFYGLVIYVFLLSKSSDSPGSFTKMVKKYFDGHSRGLIKWFFDKRLELSNQPVVVVEKRRNLAPSVILNSCFWSDQRAR